MIIVTGLPRSGTSLMCQLLKSAGFSVADDGKRKADEHNPYGYYEIENPESVSGYDAVKIVIPRIQRVYDSKHKIIVMVRPPDDIALSIKKMTGKPINPSSLLSLRKQGTKLIKRRFKEIEFISFNSLLRKERRKIEKLEKFIGKKVDTKIIHSRN